MSYESHNAEKELWEACSKGDLEQVQTLMARHPRMDLNWKDEEYTRTAFYRACFFGHADIVRVLLAAPTIEINHRQRQGATAFNIACQEGRLEVVDLLLADSRTDVITPDKLLASPFYFACQDGHETIVARLLADPRIEVNQLTDSSTSPLWITAQNGHLPLARLILASPCVVNTGVSTMSGSLSWHGTTAYTIGKRQAKSRKGSIESDEDFAKRVTNGPLIADLIHEYEENPVRVREEQRRHPTISKYFVAELFVLVVFHSDGYVRCGHKAGSNVARFFRIMDALPMEIQMVLCNRTFSSPASLVLTLLSEHGFRKLGRSSTWH